MPTAEAKVSDVTAYSDDIAIKWAEISALLGGTQAMRAARGLYLPQATAEDSGDYDKRLSRSFLFNAYEDTLKRLTDKPFCQPVVVTDLPEQLLYLASDVDSCNTDLSTFAKQLLEEGVNFGLFLVFVDFTSVDKDERNVTKAEEKAQGKRVSFNIISAPDLIGYQTEDRNGELVLTQIRFRYSVLENDGKYGQKEVHYVKVVSETSWEIHKKKDDSNEYVLLETEDHTFGEIPLYVGYLNRKGFMSAEPALMSLADKNVEHWQSSSEQRHILGFARFAILFSKGWDNDPKAGPRVIGPSNTIHAPEEKADLKFVEHSGKAIEAGQKDIDKIENQMQQLGAQPLIARRGTETATGKGIDEDNANCELKSWIREIRTALVAITAIAAKWHGIDELPENFDIEIYKDFTISLIGSGDTETLLKLNKARILTGVTVLNEVQRRGVISEKIDTKEEFEAAQKEVSMDSLLLNMPDEGEEPEDDDLDGEE